jgi:hypothetical protein
MDAQSAVAAALPVFGATQPGQWGALRAGMARAGIPAPLAAEVVAFMPIAFGRELLHGMGIDFSPDYATYSPEGGTRVAGKLAEQPVFAAAAALAAGMVERQEGGDAFVAVGTWSSEFSAVNQALNAGSQLSDLVAGPPVVILGGASPASTADAPAPPAAPASPSPPPSPEVAGEKRPWWKVWG